MWKEIEGFDNQYVSTKGEVIGVSGITLKPIYDKDGYTKVTLTSNKGKRMSKRIHRLVAKAFIENKEGKPVVNHLNGVKDDNRLENLEWATISENALHAYREGIMKHPGNITTLVYRGDSLIGAYKNKKEASVRLNVNRATLDAHIEESKLLYGELRVVESSRSLELIENLNCYNKTIIEKDWTISANSKPLIADEKVFESAREASKHFDINVKTVRKYLKEETRYMGILFVGITPYQYLTRMKA